MSKGRFHGGYYNPGREGMTHGKDKRGRGMRRGVLAIHWAATRPRREKASK